MKLIVIGLMPGLMLTASSSAGSAEETGYPIITFKEGLKEALKGDRDWKMCGDYFAAAETTNGRVVHFSYQKGSSSNFSTVFAFATMDQMIVSINKKMTAPTVAIIGNGRDALFLLRMKPEDYGAGLPCLAKGTEV